MGQEVILQNSINRLKKFWEEQNITSQGNTFMEIQKFENEHKIQMPEDFRMLYQNVNGMEVLYPSRTDREGFLFYPLQEIIDFKSEFNGRDLPAIKKNEEQCLIFMNYLQKSWWYGVLFSIKEPKEYSIVIIPDESRCKVLTKSLSGFIDWYICDSPVLYDYE